MHMERALGYSLEQSRSEQIKSLGFLCYNLYIDGVMVFPEMNEVVAEIKKSLNYLIILQHNNISDDYIKIQESSLNEKLTELGCICYNLYVDSKLFNTNVLSLCDSISAINKEITEIKVTASTNNDSIYEYQSEKEPASGYRKVSGHKLKVNCPYGMEPIPSNYKRCICGYRNRHEAKYCAKCGTKL